MLTTDERSESAAGPRPGDPATRREASALPLTKIVATVGPASAGALTIDRLIEAGVSVFRLNFSHGTFEAHEAALDAIRTASVAAGRPVAVLGDLPGPRIRVAAVPEGGIAVEPGNTLVFVREPVVAATEADGRRHRFGSTYPGLVDDAEPGQRLLINDGTVRSLVVGRTADAIECRVTHGGLVTSGKGINLPDTRLRVATITERDWRCVDWAVAHDLDYLALSFVRTPGDVEELAEGVRLRGDDDARWIPIIAKIETPRALEQIDAITARADGLMVARGDLGVEMDLADVPVIQKRLIACAHEHGKPCIVATQMLESMIDRPTPTRAEANDVANAIFDEADAVMLSGETAVGQYPVVAVEHMRRIAARAEAHLATLPSVPSPPARLVAARSHIAALSHGAWTIAADLAARCVVIWSQTGGGARYLSRNRFRIPIVAVTSDVRAARRMQLLRGVRPHVMPLPPHLGAFTAAVDEYLQAAGIARVGDASVLLAGEPLGRPRATNTLAIHVVGDPATGYAGHD